MQGIFRFKPNRQASYNVNVMHVHKNTSHKVLQLDNLDDRGCCIIIHVQAFLFCPDAMSVSITLLNNYFPS